MKETILERISSSEEETIEILSKISGVVKPGAVIALIGDLGAGKTFAVKYFARFFGVGDADSPTFTIVNEYSGEVKIYHIDFYRINNIEELYDIGIFDFLNNRDAIVFIEWADSYPEILPEERIEISIGIIDEWKRKIKIERNR